MVATQGVASGAALGTGTVSLYSFNVPHVKASTDFDVNAIGPVSAYAHANVSAQADCVANATGGVAMLFNLSWPSFPNPQWMNLPMGRASAKVVGNFGYSASHHGQDIYVVTPVGGGAQIVMPTGSTGYFKSHATTTTQGVTDWLKATAGGSASAPTPPATGVITGRIYGEVVAY